MPSIAGILLSLVVLMLLAFRGVSVFQLAPLAALLTVKFSQALLLASHPEVFRPSLGGFMALYFPLFLLGALAVKLAGAGQLKPGLEMRRFDAV